MTPTITAFKASPDRGRGLARDMPVRWAFEEVGAPYEVQLVTFPEMKEPAHRARNPFGSIPTYQAGDLTLFESSAIVLHIAETHPGLIPADPDARSRAIAWMFAAVTTIQQPIVDREAMLLTERDKPWCEERAKICAERISSKLRDLSNHLGDHDWLDGAFSAADILMVCVLRRPAGAPLVSEFANLAAYVGRAEARPAWRRAFAAQYAVFEAAQKAG